MTNTITEMCPFCSHEVTLEWDIKKYGLEVFCPFCGNKLLLCSECSENCNLNSQTGCKNAYRLIEMKFNLLSNEEDQMVCFRLSADSTVEQLRNTILKYIKLFRQDTFHGSELLDSFEIMLECATKEIGAEYYLKEIKTQSFDLWN